MNQKIIFRTGILVAIVALTIGVFAWKVNQLSQFSYSPTVTKKPIKKQSVVENKADETSDWQTYRNEKYGFEFKYPKEWLFDENKSMFVDPNIPQKCVLEESESFISLYECIKYKYAYFYIHKNEEKLTINEFFEEAGWKEGENYIDFKEIKIGNNTAYTSITNGDWYQKNLWIPLSDGSFFVLSKYSEGQGIVLDKIISTFKFTDEAADWRTYRNEELGFEFRYPSDYGNLNLKIFKDYFVGNFSDINNIDIGGITKDYRDERSSFYRDFSGFKMENGKYLWGVVADMYEPIVPNRILNKDIIIVDCMSFLEKCKPTGPSVMVPPGVIAGLVNLNGVKFKGLLLTADKNLIAESLFIKIVSTFKFTN